MKRARARQNSSALLALCLVAAGSQISCNRLRRWIGSSSPATPAPADAAALAPADTATPAPADAAAPAPANTATPAPANTAAPADALAPALTAAAPAPALTEPPAAGATPSTPSLRWDLVRDNAPAGARLSGFGEPEHNSESQWRWLEGPEAKVLVRLPSAATLDLDYAFSRPIPGQEVLIQWNGKTVAAFTGQGPLARTLQLSGVAGPNELSFRFTAWNHGNTTFAPTDARQLAIIAEKLILSSH